jgi:hypothetical protein
MNKVNFAKPRLDAFMAVVADVLADNPWITQVVSIDLSPPEHNGSIEAAVKNFDDVSAWVHANAEGRFVRVGHSRTYGFELETDIVLFHLTWGKG